MPHSPIKLARIKEAISGMTKAGFVPGIFLDYEVDDAMHLAAAASIKSPCRSKRGCIAWTTNREQWGAWIGWNQQPQGFSCDGSEACKRRCRHSAIHAEQAVIMAAGPERLRGAWMLHIKRVDGRIESSGPPSCPRCSGMILESGVGRMWLLHNGWLRPYGAKEFHQQSLVSDEPLQLIGTKVVGA
jgi:hypothetical protein